MEREKIINIVYSSLLKKKLSVERLPVDSNSNYIHYSELTGELWRQVKYPNHAFLVAAAAAQIAEYNVTGRLGEPEKGWQSSYTKYATYGHGVEIDGVFIGDAPVRGHGALIAAKYWRKVCLPVRPGPAAEALIALGLAVAPAQVSALLRFKEPPVSANPSTTWFQLSNYVDDDSVIEEVRGAAGFATPMARWSNAPLGPLAAALYVISYIAGYRHMGLDDAKGVIVMLKKRRYPKDPRRCAMAVEFCRSNVYVWSPVRRYRLKPPISNIISTIAKARRETERLCPGDGGDDEYEEDDYDYY